MIIIGIDPSLNSTAVCIYKNEDYKVFNYTNNKATYKWIKRTSNIIDFVFHSKTTDGEYSDLEVEKLKLYDSITDRIVDDINKSVDDYAHVYIEGYSYSSNAGKIIDLVTFSTLLRSKLLKNIFITLHVVAPMTLKNSVSNLIYPQDKKGISRNPDGKAGGKFDKTDVFNALLEMGLTDEYNTYLNMNSVELLTTKSIPKPFDDINDAVLLVQVGISKNTK